MTPAEKAIGDPEGRRAGADSKRARNVLYMFLIYVLGEPARRRFAALMGGAVAQLRRDYVDAAASVQRGLFLLRLTAHALWLGALIHGIA
jgi:hypothetical protein